MKNNITPLPELGFYKLQSDVVLPQYATEGSTCFDLALYLDGETPIKYYDGYNEPREYHYGTTNYILIEPGRRYLLPTGLIFDIPEDYLVNLHIRSGTALKKGLTLVNNVGKVDWDYVQQVYLIVQNNSRSNVILNHQERIGQGELVQKVDCFLRERVCKPETKTSRNGGFNSTGIETLNIQNSAIQ